jgi:hypothetical protein
MKKLFKKKQVEKKNENSIVLTSEKVSSYQTEIRKRDSLSFLVETRCLTHTTCHVVPREQMKDLTRFLLKQLGGEL